ncbi:MAG: DAK2 domain-containing protein [Clostridiales bacterium]|nr:DAK2 domain-containing protein [Clostridiales bacterium]
MEHSIIDAALLSELLKGGYNELISQKEVINNLNVFPIPDGDTGLNMGKTLQGGIETLKEGASFKDMLKGFSKGTLMSARGNSGVILSQFFRGFAKGIADVEELTVKDFTSAMGVGRNQAYAAVVNPVEGTMLTLMTDGFLILQNKQDTIEDFESMFQILVRELEASLERTPSLLDVLEEAGVVDSGGAGFLAIFTGMKKALCGEAIEVAEESHNAPSGAAVQLLDENSEVEFGYCTEFILQLFSKKTDIEKFDIDAFIAELTKLGDSIVAIRDEDLVKVHIHTKTPEIPLAYAHKFGEFITMKIENMTVQHNEVISENADSAAAKATVPAKPKKHQKFAVVTTCTGEGFRNFFTDLGADVIIDGGQTNNPSAEDFITAFKSLDADHIVVLPNNSNIILTAEQAASLYKECDVRIIPTKSLAEGYSSLSLMDKFASDIDGLINSMTYALDNVDTALVSTATRDAQMDGVTITEGDYVGIINKEIRISAKSKLDAAVNLLKGYEDMSEKDVLTIFYGKDVGEEEASSLEDLLTEEFPLLDIGIVPGLQDVYSFVMAIE